MTKPQPLKGKHKQSQTCRTIFDGEDIRSAVEYLKIRWCLCCTSIPKCEMCIDLEEVFEDVMKEQKEGFSDG